MAITGPLSGVRVLDLSQAHAGPYGTQLLGDMGAEIIKIEPANGEVMRFMWPSHEGMSYYILALNRNKKAIVLDLKSESGKQALHDLIKVSDVIIDNREIGVMEKLGADYETAKKLNPRIISCSITGYGPTGPYAHLPSYDIIPLGMSGIVSLTGEPDRMPVRPGIALADLSGGFFGAMGVVNALYGRERTGEGCKVEVNLLDSCMSLMSSIFQDHFISGKVPGPQGSRHTLVPLLGIYPTQDGYITIGPSWPRIAKVLDVEWMITDPRFAGGIMMRAEHRKDMEDILEEALKKHTTEDWLEVMRVEGIAAGPVYSVDQVLEDPQIIHNQIVQEVEHPKYGKVRVIGSPIKMPGVIEGENTAPPTLGEHTDEVLKDLLGYSEEQITAVKQSK